jgi:hypothetical protein
VQRSGAKETGLQGAHGTQNNKGLRTRVLNRDKAVGNLACCASHLVCILRAKGSYRKGFCLLACFEIGSH